MDDRRRTASSMVAAGMVNPMAGMRFNCHPRMDDWLNAAMVFYQSLERFSGKRYWHPLNMQRLFRSREQRRFYTRRLDEKICQRYWGPELDQTDVPNLVQAPYGGFWQYQTGYVDIPSLLLDIGHWLKQRKALLEQVCDYQQIKLSDRHVSYGDIRAKFLIFCEGYRMQANPWFKALPLQPDKGEILTLGSNENLCKTIINSAHWLVPLRNGDYRFGATHQHQSIDNQPTRQGEKDLRQGLDALLTSSDGLRIKSHLAGVRPATRDRHPFIGVHATHWQLGLFNGFGARGALTIPWYSQRLVNHWLDSVDLPAEANIERCI